MLKKSKPAMRHLLSMQTIDKQTILYLFDKTTHFIKNCLDKECVFNDLAGRVVVNLFFEPSTRTRNSFEVATRRLSGIVLSPDMSTSSTLKGESLVDTICTFEAMGADLLIVRHSNNHMAQFMASELKSTTAVINAGDGMNQHPTQALLDLYTIYNHKSDFNSLTVAIVGDIAHSRVARSLIQGLKTMGVPHINLIAPESLLPENTDPAVKVFNSLDDGIKNTDVVYALRIQKERMQEADIPDFEQFFKQFGVTTEKLALAKKDAIVMHPGPMNRGVEIESSVADGPQSVILEQVRNGVAMRMSIMQTLLS